MKWNITKHTYLIHLANDIETIFFFRNTDLLYLIKQWFLQFPFNVTWKKKENIKTLLTPQCDFYYHQKFNSYMIFFITYQVLTCTYLL